MAKEVESNGDQRQPETAKRFFDRAAEVALTSNYDYALELYRDGIKWDPDALEGGHKPLREIGLKRKLSGGKGPGFGDQGGLRKAKGPNEKLAWAVYMLAKDPENPRYMELALQQAVKLKAADTAKWLAILLVQANRDSGKPTLERYIVAVDALEELEVFDQAVVACQLACRIRPNDMALTDRLKNLSARQTMQRGKYETAADFKDSLLDADKQKALQDDQRVISSDDIVDRQIADARRDLAANPDQPGKIYALVDALTKRNRESEENEAIRLLDQSYQQSRSYRFRERVGDIRMRQYHRKATEAMQALQADPKNPELLKQAQQITLEARAFEESQYAERVANYPTDLALKYEYARRLFANKKYDDAIPMLQQAENDPKSRLKAMSLLGQAFFNLNFFNESVNTFRRAIEDLEIGGSEIAKDLHYNLGRALEEMGSTAEADAAYSQVMQWDFNYRDVRQRLQKLRSKSA